MKAQYLGLAALAGAIAPLVAAVASQPYTWKNVHIGGGGGFVPGIVFSTKQKGIAYARTDIGGAYRLNADDSWTPLLDWVGPDNWNAMGVNALALDPTDASRLYLATGLYTNDWDPKNGNILISTDYGKTFSASPLPFKVGGNMPGRGTGERLAVDPNSPNILYFGAQSGNGLYKSTDYGKTWAKVSALPDPGTYVPDATDSTGYNAQKVGVSFVTFDSTSGSSGKATPRMFVGVASVGKPNIYVSTDAGASFSPLAGTNTSWIPHKGVLSPAEKSIYFSFANGAGPYDGSYGGVYKYNISSGVLADITPEAQSEIISGFGGLTVDLQNPGTVMVATLNSWWPDANIFRSLDGGKTWSRLWAWNGYPTLNRYYSYDDTLAPWIGPNYNIGDAQTNQIGWMIESLNIDPFDSNHWLYGTGKTVYGSHDLLKWDTQHNVTIKSLADGIEEDAILGLISPPSGVAHLVSASGDNSGWVHTDLDTPPKTQFTLPGWTTSSDIDYAGNKPANYIRPGTGTDGTPQIALSYDSGATWSLFYGAPGGAQGGKVAYGADGDAMLWSSANQGVYASLNSGNFAPVSALPQNAVIAADKKNGSVFYATSGSKFWISTNKAATFTTTTGSLGSSTAAVKIVANFATAGDLWVSTDMGLFHSSNYGASFTAVSGITQAWAIALGAPKTTGGYPALYAGATLNGGFGYFRSDDQGANWVQINDAAHGFGSTNQVMSGDPRIYGRIYLTGDGRGIFYGDVAGAAPTSTSTTVTSTSTTSTSSTSTSTTSTTKTTTTTTTTSSTTSTSSTSTTKTTTTTTSTTSTTAVPTCSAVPKYGQCGGIGYTGCTVCQSGSKCTYGNDYYSQCQ